MARRNEEGEPVGEKPSRVRGRMRLFRGASSWRKLAIVILALILVLAPAVFVGAGFRGIEAGHKGVILNSPSGPSRDEINEGWNFNPSFIVSSIIVVRWNTQTRDMSQETGTSLTVRSSDNLNIQMDLSLVFHFRPDRVADIFIDYGNVYELIDRYMRNVPRNVASNFTGEYIGGIGRVIVEDEIQRLITSELLAYNVIVEDVLLRAVDLPDTVDIAIEEKLAAQQKVVTAELERQATIIRALAEADALRITASGERNATIIRANGTAESIRIIIEQLRISDPNLVNATWAYLTLMFIEALKENPNVVWVIVGPDGIPIILNPNPP